MKTKVCTIVYISDRVLPPMPLKYGTKIVLNNVGGCKTLNQVRPYTRPCQLRAKKPNWHLLLNRDESICLHPRYLPCIPPSWISGHGRIHSTVSAWPSCLHIGRPREPGYREASLHCRLAERQERVRRFTQMDPKGPKWTQMATQMDPNGDPNGQILTLNDEIWYYNF